MNKKRFLIDCDGILSDYVSSALELIEQHTGEKYDPEEITKWEVFEALGVSHLKKLEKERLQYPGWCAAFKVFPGAKEAMKKLNNLCEVVVVTSPMQTPFWCYERTNWLTTHFDIPKSRVVYAKNKEYVAGDFFLDDSDENCLAWSDEYPDKLTMIWDRSYNRKTDLSSEGIKRVYCWNDVFECIKDRI
jgi:5'-nucleotidase